jgi:outer membrane biosynthesis protein TonB
MPKKKPVSEEVETQTTPVVTQTPEPTEKPKAKRKTKKKISSNWDKLVGLVLIRC